MSELELEKKALLGDQEAQCSLALLHEIGLDRPQDFEKSAYFWQMACLQGSERAWEKLRTLCDLGLVSASWKYDLVQPERSTQGPLTVLPKVGRRVLVMSDDRDFRANLLETLQSVGYRALVASNVQEGLQLVRQTPDLAVIVSEMKLPNMNPLSFQMALRNLKLGVEPPVIVITATDEPKTREEGYKLGVNAWIIKPMKKARLLETLHLALKKRT